MNKRLANSCFLWRLALACAALTGAAAFQPARQTRIAFEVASVKPDRTAAPPRSNFPLNAGGMYTRVGNRFSATNFPLITYIAFAYNLLGNQLHALAPQLPAWATTDGFDIEARAPGDPTKDEMRLMMRSLLAERFKFTIHAETRQMPVLALVLAKPGKLGPGLRPHPANAPCQSDPTTDMFSQRTNPGRPIVDGTGLKGTLDFLIEFVPGSDHPAPQELTSPPPADGPTFEEALRDQLGLKMERRKSDMRMMVVDRVERPSSN